VEGYESALKEVSYEIVHFNIMEDVTVFWKANGDPEWMAADTVLQQRVTAIAWYLREVACIKVEVDEWYFQHQLMLYRPKDSENAQDRHGRCQQFWADFHESSRKTEPTAIRAPFRDDLRKRVYRDNLDDMPPETPRARTPGGTVLKSRARSRGGGSGAIIHDFDWKNRSVRSKVSAGSWDWAHGSPDLLRSATPARKQRHDHWSTTLFDLSDDELEEYHDPIPVEDEDKESEIDDVTADDTFMTQISSRPISPQDLPPPRTATSMGQKSTSLPNLQRLTAAFKPESLRAKSSQSVQSFTGSMADHNFLPPVNNAFSVPWQNTCPIPALKCTDSPTKRYLRACHKGKNIPRPLPFITGHSMKFNASGHTLFDKDLAAVTVTMEEIGIEEVDLTGNSSLSERSLLKFMQALSRRPASFSLRSLNLRRVLNAGQVVLDIVVKMIASPEGVINLRSLDLTDVHLGMVCRGPFAKAVRDHRALKTLTLMNTGIGSGLQ
jgi:hypothetical protein